MVSRSHTANRAGSVLTQATASPGRRLTSAVPWLTVSRPARVIRMITNSPSVSASWRRCRVPEQGSHSQSTSARSPIQDRRTVAVKPTPGSGTATDQDRWVADSAPCQCSTESWSVGSVLQVSYAVVVTPTPSARPRRRPWGRVRR